MSYDYGLILNIVAVGILDDKTFRTAGRTKSIDLFFPTILFRDFLGRTIFFFAFGWYLPVTLYCLCGLYRFCSVYSVP